LAAGVTIGLSIGLGGLGATLLGVLADALGLRAVFEVIAILPLLALGLTFALPREHQAKAVWRQERPAPPRNQQPSAR
jgi:FSR family fosmidomycin resistance protein-like MFS transporter